MTLFTYAESQKPKILVFVLNALQNFSTKRFDRYEDLEFMFRNIYQKGQNNIVDLLISHLVFNSWNAASENFIPPGPSKESQVLKNIFHRISNKNDIITSIEILISENDNVPSAFKNEPNIWARWPDLLTIYPYMENKAKLIDAALLQLQSNYKVFVISACESLPGMYKDALNKSIILNVLQTLLIHPDDACKSCTGPRQNLAEVGIHEKNQIRQTLKNIVTDEVGMVRWEECPSLLQVFLHSQAPDDDELQMVIAALIQLRSQSLDWRKMGSQALETMHLQEHYN